MALDSRGGNAVGTFVYLVPHLDGGAATSVDLTPLIGADAICQGLLCLPSGCTISAAERDGGTAWLFALDGGVRVDVAVQPCSIVNDGLSFFGAPPDAGPHVLQRLSPSGALVGPAFSLGLQAGQPDVVAVDSDGQGNTLFATSGLVGVDRWQTRAVLVRTTGLGTACTQPSDCDLGVCVDGVCCDSACGGGLPTDCQACSVAMGASIDGTCATLGAGEVCRPSVAACDPEEVCDGTARVCPPDVSSCVAMPDAGSNDGGSSTDGGDTSDGGLAARSLRVGCGCGSTGDAWLAAVLATVCLARRRARRGLNVGRAGVGGTHGSLFSSGS